MTSMVEQSSEMPGVPGVDEQKKRILDLDTGENKVELKEGDTWYLVDADWFSRWQAYVGVDEEPNGIHPGEISNASLLSPGATSHAHLRPYLRELSDFMLVCEPMWTDLVAWYGGGPAIPRPVVRREYSRQLVVETQMLHIKLVKSSRLDDVVMGTFAKQTKLKELREKGCALLNLDEKDVQMWDYHQGVKAKLLVDLASSLRDENIISQQLVLFEERGPDGRFPRAKKKRDFRPVENAVPGKCGFTNLGNTCFMNSALQCLSASSPLRRFFMSRAFENDLNPDNPLGCGGELAQTYFDVLQAAWTGHYSSFAPRDFKHALERFSPQFAGYQQHDAQELLAFLLDGLHEDLNRVKKKPFVEQRESDGRDDQTVADEAWRDHLQRNDSLIVDEFQGQLKSTVECNECDRVSVTFDPFMYLSVPLPQVTTKRIVVTVVPMNGSALVKYGVTVQKTDTVAELQTGLAAVSGIAPESLFLVDLFQSKMSPYSSSSPVSKISARDDTFAFEVLRKSPVKRDPAPDTTQSASDMHASLDNGTSLDVDVDEVAQAAAVAADASEEDSDDDQGNFYLILNHKRNSGYSQFGVPLILSFAQKPTYAQLVTHVYHRIKRVLLDKPRAKVAYSPYGHSSSYSSYSYGSVVPYKYPSATLDDDDSEDEKVSEDPPEPEPALAEPDPAWMDGMAEEVRRMARSIELRIKIDHYRDETLSPDGELKLSSRDEVFAIWGDELERRYNAAGDVAELHESARVRDESVTATLDECLEMFMKKEQLGEDNPWYCNVCKKHQRAFKKFDIWRWPRTLVVHLKRFSYSGINSRFMQRGKLDTLVDFPIRELDIAPFTANNNEREYKFRLYGVVNHFGGMGGGHYIAHATHQQSKPADEAQWYRFDDSSVSEAKQSDIVSNSSYVLFYRRMDTIDPAEAELEAQEAVRHPEEEESDEDTIDMEAEPVEMQPVATDDAFDTIDMDADDATSDILPRVSPNVSDDDAIPPLEAALPLDDGYASD